VRNLLVIFIFSLTGCGAIECLDSQFERAPIPIKGSNAIEFQYKDQAVIIKPVQCEKFYDAMCADRGNYWTVSETGFKRKYTTSKINIKVDGVGEIEVSHPTCEDLVQNKKITLKI
jgi:hypothetical protein